MEDIQEKNKWPFLGIFLKDIVRQNSQKWLILGVNAPKQRKILSDAKIRFEKTPNQKDNFYNFQPGHFWAF